MSTIGSITLPEEFLANRLDKTLAIILTNYSRCNLQAAIVAGLIKLNNCVITKPKQKVFPGDLIAWQLDLASNHNQTEFTAEAISLEVVYEDTQIIILNKPADLVVHPAAGNWQGTLLNGLIYRFPELRAIPRAGIVHRLDKDTTGLMVIARTLDAQTNLLNQFKLRSLKRSYLAIVFGIAPLSGNIDAAIGRDLRFRAKMALTPNGKQARTSFKRLEFKILDLAQAGYGKTNEQLKFSLLHCELDTGRTHQIRVHLAHLNLPLVGDQTYKSNSQKNYLLKLMNQSSSNCYTNSNPNNNQISALLLYLSTFKRQALHAYKLSLTHPATKEVMTWKIGAPHDIKDLSAYLGWLLI